jgi:hypothetical protein
LVEEERRKGLTPIGEDAIDSVFELACQFYTVKERVDGHTWEYLWIARALALVRNA